MKDVKELWKKYQMETALQLIELDGPDHNETRIKELETKLKEALSTPAPGYDMAISKSRPEA